MKNLMFRYILEFINEFLLDLHDRLVKKSSK